MDVLFQDICGQSVTIKLPMNATVSDACRYLSKQIEVSQNIILLVSHDANRKHFFYQNEDSIITILRNNHDYDYIIFMKCPKIDYKLHRNEKRNAMGGRKITKPIKKLNKDFVHDIRHLNKRHYRSFLPIYRDYGRVLNNVPYDLQSRINQIAPLGYQIEDIKEALRSSFYDVQGAINILVNRNSNRENDEDRDFRMLRPFRHNFNRSQYLDDDVMFIPFDFMESRLPRSPMKRANHPPKDQRNEKPQNDSMDPFIDAFDFTDSDDLFIEPEFNDPIDFKPHISDNDDDDNDDNDDKDFRPSAISINQQVPTFQQIRPKNNRRHHHHHLPPQSQRSQPPPPYNPPSRIDRSTSPQEMQPSRHNHKSSLSQKRPSSRHNKSSLPQEMPPSSHNKYSPPQKSPSLQSKPKSQPPPPPKSQPPPPQKSQQPPPQQSNNQEHFISVKYNPNSSQRKIEVKVELPNHSQNKNQPLFTFAKPKNTQPPSPKLEEEDPEIQAQNEEEPITKSRRAPNIKKFKPKISRID